AAVNIGRAIPFIILLVALLPVTRAIVGTTLGTWAAVVPLSANLIPFFARIAQVSLGEVDSGLVEAARAMGLRRPQIVRQVLLPEALPGLIGGMTVSVIAMVNASAMAGAVGAGGLGDLAIRYGYERYETRVMFEVIVILVALVSVLQFGGEWLARRADHRRSIS
ncbi:MAG: ABC transporter permease, partial [Delftia sp.]|nr:ABC transporter permease [Delftia sp.]